MTEHDEAKTVYRGEDGGGQQEYRRGESKRGFCAVSRSSQRERKSKMGICTSNASNLCKRTERRFKQQGGNKGREGNTPGLDSCSQWAALKIELNRNIDVHM